MDLYDLITKAIESFRRTNKINPLNIRKIIDVEKDAKVIIGA